jgi:HEAT repeat protein
MSNENIDDLFAATLIGDPDDEAPNAAISALRRMGTREVFERAIQWCKSEDSRKRSRGVQVLAQLGKTVERPSNSFPDESYAAVVRLVESESEIEPLSSGIHALGHLDNPEAIPLIQRFQKHANADLRFAVACALGTYPNAEASVFTLLELARDAEADVRDWAVFGIGVLGDRDSEEIRNVLVDSLADENGDVREEAMVGLAKRNDLRVLPTLIEALSQPTYTVRVAEAAYTMLGMHSKPEGWDADDYVVALRQSFPEQTKHFRFLKPRRTCDDSPAWSKAERRVPPTNADFRSRR